VDVGFADRRRQICAPTRALGAAGSVRAHRENLDQSRDSQARATPRCYDGSARAPPIVAPRWPADLELWRSAREGRPSLASTWRGSFPFPELLRSQKEIGRAVNRAPHRGQDRPGDHQPPPWLCRGVDDDPARHNRGGRPGGEQCPGQEHGTLCDHPDPAVVLEHVQHGRAANLRIGRGGPVRVRPPLSSPLDPRCHGSSIPARVYGTLPRARRMVPAL
jgi:hypothetical protein